jgi:hypothetical protein
MTLARLLPLRESRAGSLTSAPATEMFLFSDTIDITIKLENNFCCSSVLCRFFDLFYSQRMPRATT